MMMELKVRRIARRDAYTIGRLYIDGAYFCDTIEDTDRGLRQDLPESINRALYARLKGAKDKIFITIE